MSYYLSKYKGKYRLMADIDLNTNDFARDEKGSLVENDVYIKCRKGRIYHYGRNVLVCYVNKLVAGRNILKDIGRKAGINLDKYFYETEDRKVYDYKNFYKELTSTGIVFNIEETDEEVLWRFKDKNIEIMAEYMQAQTLGAGISPFSRRNLPNINYVINGEQMKEYKEITACVPQEDTLIISKITARFMADIMAKSKPYRGKNLKDIQRKKMIKGNKEFIHSEGFWEQYLDFLRKNINSQGT